MSEIDYIILPRDQKRLLEAIKQAGLNPSDFIDKDTGQPYVKETRNILRASLRFKDSPLQFRFWIPSDSNRDYACYFAEYKPGYPLTEIYKIDVDDLITKFNSWLREHVLQQAQDTQIPVSWTDEPTSPELLPRNLFKRTEEDAGTYFTEDQQRELTHRLQELKTHILEEFQPDEEKAQFVIQNINLLTESAAKDDRATWKHFMLTSLSSIVVALGVEAAKRYELFQWVENLFKSFPMLTQ